MCGDLDAFGRLTAREFDAWFIQVNDERRKEFDRLKAGMPSAGSATTNAGPAEDLSKYGMKPGDKVVGGGGELTDDGALFLLRSMGVQGVPDNPT